MKKSGPLCKGNCDGDGPVRFLNARMYCVDCYPNGPDDESQSNNSPIPSDPSNSTTDPDPK